MMLITETYRAEQAALHSVGNYGTASLQYGATVEALLRNTGARSLLDYGCGSKRSLQQVLKLPQGTVYEGYDPAVPEYSATPLPAELVCCIDVLEHIEPALLDNVLDHLAQLCDPYGFFTVHSGPAKKVLSDGRNAHLTQQGPDWWMPRLASRFEVLTLQPIPSGFAIAVRSRQSEAQLPPLGPLALPRNNVDASSAAASVAAVRAVAIAPSENVGPPRTVFKYKGQRIVYNTPNDVTISRVRTILTKEPDTIQWLESLAQHAVLLDVGANVGMYSMFAAVMRQATVYAFEPESQNYALLNANIEANQLSGQVIAYPLALSDGARLDRLYLQGFTPGGSCNSFGEEVGFDLKPRGAGFVQGAYSVAIDQLIEDGSMPVPDYIKLDVDGFEHKVLRGATKTLANPKVKEIIVELNTHLEEHRSVIEWLQSLGFEYDENQAKGALRKSGIFEGVGEFIFRRGVLPPAMDTLNRKFAITTAPTARGRAVLDHVMQRVAAATVIEDPFPYAVIDRIFPDDYYAEMLAHFPKPDSLRPIGETGRVAKDNYRDRLVVLFTDEEFERMTGKQQRFWREFAGWMYSDLFLNLFVLKFHHALEPRLCRILANGPLLRARGDALLVNDQTNYAIGPHTDAPHRLVTFLFYLPKDESMKELGTSVYRAKDPNFVCWGGPHHPSKQFDLVRTVEFLPNRLLTFPKTERSFHGVEQIHRTDVNRPLLINNIRLLNPVTH
jgi:FkbM family methyltransferase